MSERKLPHILILVLFYYDKFAREFHCPYHDRVARSLAAKIPLQDGLVIGKPSRPTEKHILTSIFVSVESQGDNRSRV